MLIAGSLFHICLTFLDCHVLVSRFDCGFFSILFMEHFTGKVMPDFDKITIPDMRRLLAASLIDSRDNQKDDIEAIMNEDLQK